MGRVFLSTPPSRVATFHVGISKLLFVFLSTPPSRVATSSLVFSLYCLLSFYPRHPRGWRPKSGSGDATTFLFLSTPPSRVATRAYLPCPGRHLRFYPRHPRGWRPPAPKNGSTRRKVSIHATLAGGDANPLYRQNYDIIVSIHATLAGGDLFTPTRTTWTRMFLSTPPSRVATPFSAVFVPLWFQFLSTPPSRVATIRTGHKRAASVFLSTPPSRVATGRGA